MAKILVIDDDPELRTILREMLAKAGHQILVAADGRDGLTLYRECRPDLIITDIFMPGRDGLYVIKEVAHDADVKVIAISGGGRNRDFDVLREARDFGAWRTLQKPFGPNELLTLIDDVLAG